MSPSPFNTGRAAEVYLRVISVAEKESFEASDHETTDGESDDLPLQVANDVGPGSEGMLKEDVEAVDDEEEEQEEEPSLDGQEAQEEEHEEREGVSPGIE